MPQRRHLIRCGGACGSRPSRRCAWAAPRSGSSRRAPRTELVAAVRARPALVLAGGSNVVIADEGVPGHGRARAHARDLASRTDVLVVAAGEPWDDVVARCVAEGLQGFECLSGIPGSTGATPIQNVGAYGQDVVRDGRVGARLRPRDRRGAGDDRGRVRLRLPHAASSSTATAGRCWPSRSGCASRSDVSGPLRYAELARVARRAGRRPRAAGGRARGGAGAAARQGHGDRPGRPRLGQRRLVLHEPDPGARRVGGDPRRPARLAGARRPDQDLRGVADRALRLRARVRRRTRRDLVASTRSRWSTAAARRPPS